MHGGRTLVHSGVALVNSGFTLAHGGFQLEQTGLALEHIGNRQLHIGFAPAHIAGIIGCTVVICGIICGTAGDITGDVIGICDIIEQGNVESGEHRGHGHGLRGIGPGPADNTGSEPVVDCGLNCCWPKELKRGS